MGCKPTASIPWDQFGAPSLVTEQENYVHEIIRCDVDGLRDIHRTDWDDGCDGVWKQKGLMIVMEPFILSKLYNSLSEAKDLSPTGDICVEWPVFLVYFPLCPIVFFPFYILSKSAGMIQLCPTCHGDEHPPEPSNLRGFDPVSERGTPHAFDGPCS